MSYRYEDWPAPPGYAQCFFEERRPASLLPITALPELGELRMIWFNYDNAEFVLRRYGLKLAVILDHLTFGLDSPCHPLNRPPGHYGDGPNVF